MYVYILLTTYTNIIAYFNFNHRLAVVRGPDPALPEVQIVQRAKGDFRRIKGLDASGKAKAAMSAKLRVAQQKHVDNARTTYHASRSRSQQSLADGSSILSSDPLSSFKLPPSSLSPPPSPSSSSDSSLPQLGFDLTNMPPPPPPAKKRRLSEDQRLTLIGARELEPEESISNFYTRKRKQRVA
jgi:hypothetical protein